jgi:hypothetical protein
VQDRAVTEGDDASQEKAWDLILSDGELNRNESLPQQEPSGPAPTPVPTPSAVIDPPVNLVVRDTPLDGLGHASMIQGISDTDMSFFARHTGILYMIIAAAIISSLTSACIIIVAAWAIVSPTVAPVPSVGTSAARDCASWANSAGSSSSGSSERASVESLVVCQAHEIDSRLPCAGGYDCMLSQPQNSKELVRLVGCVERSHASAVLTSPLTRQDCVIFSAVVSRHVHAGVPPVPVAFASCHAAFLVAVGDDPQKKRVRVEIDGEDVSLFDMCIGRHAARQPFALAPDHWQDFVLTHRAASSCVRTEFQASSSLRADSTHLEFQECSLVVGATVTLVGELHRSAHGTLSLKPLHGNGQASMKNELSTSWERDNHDTAIADIATTTPQKAPGFEKVLVSDDPSLLSSPASLADILAARADSPVPAPPTAAASASSNLASRFLQQPLLSNFVRALRPCLASPPR